MKNTQKVKNCREGRRCSRPLSCRFCGEGWQRAKFKGFTQCLDNLDEVTLLSDTALTYIIIRSKKMGTLREKLKELLILMNEIKELKKRGKLGVFFGRLEVDYTKGRLGFNPHLNLLVWGDSSVFKSLAKSLSLVFWSRKKDNDKKTAKSIAWYALKFNPIGIEKGEAVRVALEKKRTVIHSREFNFKTISYIDEIIDMDFSFLGVYPIRSKKGILWREIKKRINKYLDAKIKEADRDFS